MAKSQNVETPYLDTRGASRYLGVSPGWLETLRSRGGGPTFATLGRRVVYRIDDLDVWVNLQRHRSTQQKRRG